MKSFHTAEGHRYYGSKACNEILSVKDDQDERCLRSLMGPGFVRLELPFDLKRMSAEQAARNSGRFGGFSTFSLQIIRICAIMPSKNGNAAERAQLTEAYMENRKASRPKRRFDARDAMRANRAGERKNTLGGSAQVLDKARFGQGNPSFSLGWIWPGFAGFGSIWPNLDFGLDFPWMLSVAHRRN